MAQLFKSDGTVTTLSTKGLKPTFAELLSKKMYSMEIMIHGQLTQIVLKKKGGMVQLNL